MRKLGTLALGPAGIAAGLLLAAAGARACEMPSMVEIPDGATATTEQMVDAREQVSAYVAAMEEYLVCLDEELAAEGAQAPDEFRVLMGRRREEAVNEIETVAAAFNEELSAFRAASAEPDAEPSP